MKPHQREQGEDLGLLRQHPRKQATEPERVDAQIAAGREVGPAAEVALVEHDVEGCEHLGEPLRQFIRLGNPVRDAGADDLPLGADDALRHGRLGDQERVSDLACCHAHDGAEGQSDLGVPSECWMAAGEDEA